MSCDNVENFTHGVMERERAVMCMHRYYIQFQLSIKIMCLLVLFPDGKCFPALSGSPVIPIGQAGDLSVCPEIMSTLTTQ
jgi:hypothetical protein